MHKKYLAFHFMLFFVTLNAQNIKGFKAENVQKQLDLETTFESKISTKNLDSWMKKMAARPHYVGTDYGKELAEWMLKQFKSWGYDAKIETYQVLFPYPKVRVLELKEPTTYKAKLTAVPVEGDAYTAQ